MAKVRKRTWTTGSGEKRSAWAVDFVDAQGDRQRRQFTTKREAEDFRIQTESQVRAGTFRSGADRVTVKEVAEAYLTHCKGRQERQEKMTRHHLETVEGIVKNHILDAEAGVGGIKLAHLTASKVRSFRDRLREAGVSVPMTRKTIGVLARILGHAVANDLIAVNTARGIEVIARRDQGSKKVTPPTKAQLSQLLAKADEEFSIVILFAAASGMRAGELWALRWRHLDFARRKVLVETRVDRFKEEDTTKSEAGVRKIPIGAAILKTLKAWRLRSKFSKADDLVFPNRRGGFVNHDNRMHRTFRPLCLKAEVAGLKWHALRHFAISTWIEAGLAPKTVQTFAGHSSLEMTMDRYGHLFPSDDHLKAFDAIATGLLKPVGTQTAHVPVKASANHR